jgi:DNA-binding transcriptional regulator GbsR (MarR family)
MSPSASSQSQSTPIPSHNGVSDFEQEIITMFVGLARILGLPRSVGEIYGLLFASENPLCMEDVINRLNISKGSASHGLRQLRDFGAIRSVYVPGDRKDRFLAVRELKPLLSRFISDQLQPHLVGGADRVARLRELVRAKGNEASAIETLCVDRLAKWHSRAQTLAPLITRFVGK